MYKILILER